jgi:PAS domain S-box-containing protein
MSADITPVEQLTQELDRLRQQIANLEEQLAANESAQQAQSLSAAIETATDGIATLNAIEQITYVNPAYAKLYGYAEPAALFGRSWLFLYPPEEQQRLQQAILPLCDRQGHWRGEAIGQRLDGSQFLQALSLTRLSNGGLICVTQDITEARQAEAALRLQEAQYRELVQAANCVILRWDTQGHIKFLNDYGQRFFGYRLEEILDRSVIGTIVPATETARRDLQALIADICQQPERYALHETENICRDGRRVWVTWANQPIISATGELSEILSVGTDATERKQAEESRRWSELQLRQQTYTLQQTLRELKQMQAQLVHSEKMLSLGQLVAGVAHEINNPVNFIHGNIQPASQYIQDLLELLELYQDQFPQATPEILTKIEEIDLEFLRIDLPKLITSMRVGTDRIREIVQSLRNFSRLDESKSKIVNIHEGLESTLLILRNRLKSTIVRDASGREHLRAAITVIKNFDHLPLVECYAGQLNQVFMNILSNAIDALDEAAGRGMAAPPWIQIQTALIAADRISIQITDNGPGMPESVRQRLFEPFFTTKSAGKGTGLGMSISYRIITEAHGGRLACVSAPRQGAQFLIELPIRLQTRSSQ